MSVCVLGGGGGVWMTRWMDEQVSGWVGRRRTYRGLVEGVGLGLHKDDKGQDRGEDGDGERHSHGKQGLGKWVGGLGDECVFVCI